MVKYRKRHRQTVGASVLCGRPVQNMSEVITTVIYVIPDAEKLPEYVEFSRQYDLGWEFNDFMYPSVLEDEEIKAGIIDKYRSYDMPARLSLHGAFLDVTVHSGDVRIRDISDFRIDQSIEVAKALGCRKVIFHSNIIPNFIDAFYCDDWVSKNAEYWTAKARQNPDIDLLMENMFDMTPDLMARLAEEISDVPNFGLCLDYSHASIFCAGGSSADIFVDKLAPYVKHIHINDCDLMHDGHLPIGDGMVDWERFAEHYSGRMSGASVLIEVKGLERQKRSLEFLTELFARYGIDPR